MAGTRGSTESVPVELFNPEIVGSLKLKTGAPQPSSPLERCLCSRMKSKTMFLCFLSRSLNISFVQLYSLNSDQKVLQLSNLAATDLVFDEH